MKVEIESETEIEKETETEKEKESTIKKEKEKEIFYTHVFVYSNKTKKGETLETMINQLKKEFETSLEVCKSHSLSFLSIGCTQEKLCGLAEKHGVQCRIRKTDPNQIQEYQVYKKENEDRFLSRDLSKTSKQQIHITPFEFDSCTSQEIIHHELLECFSVSMLEELMDDDSFVQVFALHDETELNRTIEATTKGTILGASKGKINIFRQYFGIDLSLYFSFLLKYIQMLFFPSALGLLVHWITNSEYDQPMVALAYTFFIVLWGNNFVDEWRVIKKAVQKIFNIYDPDHFTRQSNLEKTPIFDDIKKNINSPSVTVPRIVSLFTSALMLMISIACILIVNKKKVISGAETRKQLKRYQSTSIGILTGIVIAVLRTLFKKVADKLTENEKQETEKGKWKSYLLKIFLFDLVANVTYPFAIAFISRDIEFLKKTLKYIMFTKQIIGNIKDVGIPWLKYKIKIYLYNKKKIASGENPITKIEKQFLASKFQDSYEEYEEMIIQWCYISLFAVAFPLSPLFALLNNLVEQITDSKKLLFFKRPHYRKSEITISVDKYWEKIMRTLSMLSLFSNIGIIYIFYGKRFSNSLISTISIPISLAIISIISYTNFFKNSSNDGNVEK
ncbi:ngep-related [Anaeramoeba flamelloides]|uniref:Ngep-related n=1 Tax=Anaeramoeba flamelloides TaxID=1746091 RepID=A0ABQ8XNT0_9EUKA|nr:ngep-related [Anaeramoeba flamelloides]